MKSSMGMIILGFLISTTSAVAYGDTEKIVKTMSLTESEKQIEALLDSTLRCGHVSLPLGSAPGNSIGTGVYIWWQKRQYNEKHIQPFFKRVRLMRQYEAGRRHIALDLEVFLEKLSEDRKMQQCPAMAEIFFDSIEKHVELLLQEWKESKKETL